MTDNYPFSDYPFMGTFHCLYCPLRFQQLTELVAHYEEVHVPAALAEARLKSMRKEGTMWR